MIIQNNLSFWMSVEVNQLSLVFNNELYPVPYFLPIAVCSKADFLG